MLHVVFFTESDRKFRTMDICQEIINIETRKKFENINDELLKSR
jgi:hypothetical protein